MQFATLVLLLTFSSTLTTSSPVPQFWGVFEQTTLTNLLTTSSSNVKTALHILYSSHNDHVNLGNTIPPSNVTSKPRFYIAPLSSSPSATVKNATYTLVLSDPDATSRAEPVKSQMCHWIITGIQLDSTSSTLSSPSYGDYGDPANKTIEYPDFSDSALTMEGSKHNLTEIMSYLSPTPPPKTSYHRYVFVLLSDEGRGQGELEKPKERPHWGFGREGKGVMDWAEDNGLVPVGANFLYSENDEQ